MKNDKTTSAVWAQSEAVQTDTATENWSISLADRTAFDLHDILLKARARRLTLEAELAALGIAFDPRSGAVRLKADLTGSRHIGPACPTLH